MRVASMRLIDKWLGVPICWLLTLLTWPIARKYHKQKKIDISRTLFIELSEMGSAILVDPAMRKLAASGQCELFFVIFAENKASLEILQTIKNENIFTIRSKNIFLFLLDCMSFSLWCYRNKISATIDLELFSRATTILAVLSLAKYRIGFTALHDEGLSRGRILTHSIRYNPHTHIANNFIALVNKSLGKFQGEYPTVAIEPHELKLVRASVSKKAKAIVVDKIRSFYPGYFKQNIVIINPNASEMLIQRRWPLEHFAKLMTLLLAKQRNTLLLITGSGAEYDYANKLHQMVANTRCINTAGKFAFSDLVPLYSVATAMLTNDSGPAHFASVTELKIFVLFGPETPKLYGPLTNATAFYLGLPCSPCVSAANHRKTTCQSKECIVGIAPEVVFKEMDKFLTEKKTAVTSKELELSIV